MKVTKFRGNPQFFNAKLLEEDKGLAVTVEDAILRTVNNEERVSLLFVNEDRELKLTPHQVSMMARRFGDDTDGWKGVKLSLTRGEEKGVVLHILDGPEDKK